MDSEMRASLAAVADKQRLGELISVHRQERELIRARARGLWLIGWGLVVGVPLVGLQEMGDPFLVPFVAAVVMWIAGGFLAGPAAAAALPVAPARWIALYEHGLVEVRVLQEEEGARSDAGMMVRPVRFDQIVRLEQAAEISINVSPLNIPTIPPKGAWARIIAHRDGKPTSFTLAWYRHQDNVIAAVRQATMAHRAAAAADALERGERLSFGDVTISERGLAARGATPSLVGWSDVVGALRREDDHVFLYRRRRSPGDRSYMRDGSVHWYTGMIPDADVAIILIDVMLWLKGAHRLKIW